MTIHRTYSRLHYSRTPIPGHHNHSHEALTPTRRSMAPLRAVWAVFEAACQVTAPPFPLPLPQSALVKDSRFLLASPRKAISGITTLVGYTVNISSTTLKTNFSFFFFSKRFEGLARHSFESVISQSVCRCQLHHHCRVWLFGYATRLREKSIEVCSAI